MGKKVSHFLLNWVKKAMVKECFDLDVNRTVATQYGGSHTCMFFKKETNTWLILKLFTVFSQSAQVLNITFPLEEKLE